MPTAAQKTGKDKYGGAWRRPLQVHSPCWCARPQAIGSSRVAYTNAYDELGARDNAISYEVVVRNAITELYVSLAEKGETEFGARRILAQGPSSRILNNNSSAANRKGQVCTKKTFRSLGSLNQANSNSEIG